MKSARRREWFDDDAFWRDLYPFMFPSKRFADTAAEVDGMLELARPRGKAVLDLCCGPGRCSVALAQRGFAVTGVDRTKYLLAKARARARAAKVRVEWVLADMRDFVRPGAFDLALSVFTSFGYFDSKREDLLVLENLFASLRPGGACLIDVMSKERLARIYLPATCDALPDGTTLVQRHEVFDDWTRVRNEWILLRKRGVKRFRFHHTIYSGQELRDRMQEAGFSNVRLYGDFDGRPYGPDAKRLIAVGCRPHAGGTRRRATKVSGARGRPRR